jgi:hypothetical protein
MGCSVKNVNFGKTAPPSGKEVIPKYLDTIAISV